MPSFKPTNKSAFLSGVALVIFYQLLTLFEVFGAIQENTTEEHFEPFIVVFFAISVFLFFIGFERIQQNSQNTNMPFFNVPKTKEDIVIFVSVLKRALFWFFGVACGGAASNLAYLLLR